MTIAPLFPRAWPARSPLLACALLFCSLAYTAANAQAHMPAGTPLSWVQNASANELHIVDEDGTFGVRYLVRKVDVRGDVTRDVIESRDGAVARLVLRDGKPITTEEDAAERQRLTDMLASPADFAKRHKRNTSARGYSSDLIRLMPQAMIFYYVPGQPQPAGATSLQVAIDFKPDPKFQPPNMVSDLLTGIEGRLWVDAQTHTLTRAEARVTKPVDFGWGLLARIYAGGTVEFEQSRVGSGHWIYSRTEEHLRIREMMVKVATQNSVQTVSSTQLLPGTLSYQEAIHKLLDTPLPAH